MKTGTSKNTARMTFENVTPSILHMQEWAMSWCFMSVPVPWTGGFWDQVPAPILRTWGRSAILHSQLAAPTHTVEAGKATTSSYSISCSQLRGPKAGEKGRTRWRWPDILRLWRWKWSGQNGGTPCPIPDSQHTSSLLWLDGRKHLPRLNQVRLVQNYTIKKLALDEISRSTGLSWAITIQRTITILTLSLHIWSAEPKTKP